MKLFNFKHREDFGHEWYVQIINVKNWSLLQTSISWNECSSWPYIQIKSGTGSTLSILFWAHKLGLDVDILARTWKWYDEQETELV